MKKNIILKEEVQIRVQREKVEDNELKEGLEEVMHMTKLMYNRKMKT